MYNIKFKQITSLSLLLLLVFTSCTKEEISSARNLASDGEITFILGDDKASTNPYYAKAELYFRYNDDVKTEKVITHLHTLSEVQGYLCKHAPENGNPWKLVNLVSHGNEYLGLSAKVSPDGKRATSKRIIEGLNNGELRNIPTSVINEQTKIRLHGCGLGNNKSLKYALVQAFSDGINCPELNANEYFEYYLASEDTKRSITKYDAQYWMIGFKMGYQPNDNVLSRKLKNKYPNTDVNWQEALQNEQAYKQGDVFHYTFDVPVKWVIPFENKEDVPLLKTQKESLNWVKTNEKILKDLEKLEIPPDQFNWWARNIYIKNEDGTKSPALWIKGYCTMLCVLELLPENV